MQQESVPLRHQQPISMQLWQLVLCVPHPCKQRATRGRPC